MCGILGYYGEKKLITLLVEGLKKLQYRGYDSIGFCTISPESELQVFKRNGKIQDYEDDLALMNLTGDLGIAHTRWATHGEPSEINAHPHLSSDIAIVHNGIIENYDSLKKMLEKQGFEFVSETDSEVIVHLISKFYEGDLEKAVLKTLGVIEGAYGLVIIHKSHKEMIAAKKGSPLILGVGENEMFVSSDVTAILDHTKKVVYLEDGEIAIIKKDNYQIKKLNGELIDKEIHEIKWSIDKIEKLGFKHFMLKEIFEQPKSIENTLRGKLHRSEVKLSVKIPNNISKIILLACGTSWHSSLIGKYLIEKIAGIPVEVDYASEFRYRDPLVNEQNLVILISQSGETADTLAALEEAKSKGASTLGIVNVVGSEISRKVDSGIYLHAGPEIGVASTKAFSCQVISLVLFALYLKQNREDLNEDVLRELSLIPDKINDILKQSEEIKKIAINFKDSKNFLYLGRGFNFPVALEGALKLKEISYIHAEGYPAAEMKHGPIALIDENMPVVFIATKDSTYEKILSNIEEVRARGGKVIIITDQEDEKLNSLSDHIIKVPKTLEEFSPILNNIPLQLLAYYIADFKGIDVDKPRNLAKSVTVE
jgi:glutamine---fructose-6-phosphate transaminase (isomerizing)